VARLPSYTLAFALQLRKTTEVLYRTHKCPPPVPIMIQIHPVPTTPSNFPHLFKTFSIQGAPPFTCYTLLLISNPYTRLYTVCRENFSTNILSTKTLSSNKSETTLQSTSSIGTKNTSTSALNIFYCNSTQWLQCFLCIV
jgi:hypothetical protein